MSGARLAEDIGGSFAESVPEAGGRRHGRKPFSTPGAPGRPVLEGTR